jgi:hypothetical protein
MPRALELCEVLLLSKSDSDESARKDVRDLPGELVIEIWSQPPG